MTAAELATVARELGWSPDTIAASTCPAPAYPQAVETIARSAGWRPANER